MFLLGALYVAVMAILIAAGVNAGAVIVIAVLVHVRAVLVLRPDRAVRDARARW